MCWTTDSSERKRSELERSVGQEKIRVINKHNLINISGGDASLGNTRSHSEHDG